MNKTYNCDGLRICCKKIGKTIAFIDVETDGIKVSYSIQANFSKRNIEKFLLTKFKEVEIL